MDSIKAKWKNLTDSFKKCLDRERDASRSGAAGYGKPPSCRFYSQLMFLRDVISNKKTWSNVPVSTPITLPPVNSWSSLIIQDPQPSMSTVIDITANEITHTKITPTTITPTTMTPTKITPTKRRKLVESPDPVENFLISSIKEKNNPASKNEDSDELFCRSLVQPLKRLSPKTNQLARIKIQQLLFELEYNDAEK